MIAADRDALICDLAETYGIFDMRALPVSLLATLASGLREDSRIKIRLSGCKVPRSELLLAAVVDRLSVLLWALFGESSFSGSVLDILMGSAEQSSDIQTFETGDEFEDAWYRATGVRHG